MTFREWCEAQGVDPHEAKRLAEQAGVDKRELVLMAQDNAEWLAELQERAVGRTKDEAEFIKRSCRALGPESFRELSSESMLEIVAKSEPRLRVFVDRADGTRGGLLLGPTGAGKSIAACLVARKRKAAVMAAERERWASQVGTEGDAGSFGVAWYSASQLSRARRKHPLGRHDEHPDIEDAYSAKLLVLDDMGWEPAQDPICADVLSERYDRGLPTIVTTGLTESELYERYGAALVRRITETAGQAGLLVDLLSEQQKLEGVA